MGNKLFVIGGMHISSCKVFDSCSRKFTTINSAIKVSSLEINYCEAFCVGSHFHHSESHKSVLYLYDVIKLKWSTFDS